MTSSLGFLKPDRPGIRRYSSHNASYEELVSGPSVVVPPKHMMAPSNAHEVAAAIEMAKHRVEDSSSDGGSPITPPVTSVTDSYAFAFDIDGVLIRGGKPIPEAIEAMQMLNGENEYGVKVFVFYIYLSPILALTGSDHTSLSRMGVERRSRRDVCN